MKKVKSSTYLQRVGKSGRELEGVKISRKEWETTICPRKEQA